MLHRYTIALACIVACSGDDSPTDTVEEPLAKIFYPIIKSVPLGTMPGSFAVSQDGAATYSIPIEVPAGRAGIQPALSLDYSSRSGNGLYGVGWSMSGFSSITRCANNPQRDGSARGVHFDPPDKFCLDGKPLIVVSGTYGKSAEYRTEPDTFAKIVSFDTGDAAGPTRWLVYSKDGRIAEYGADSNSRREATENLLVSDTTTLPILRRWGWDIDRVDDRSGNYMQFTYGRTSTGSDFESFPSGIYYTGSTVSGATTTRSVVFEYNTLRTDLLTSHLQGITIHTTHRLTAISTYAPATTDTMPFTPPAPWIRRYTLSYLTAPVSHRSRLDNIVVCDQYLACLPPTKLTYSDAAPSFALTTQLPANPLPYATDGVPRLFTAMDIDGDGKDDIVYTNPVVSNRLTVHKSLGSTMAAATTVDIGLAEGRIATSIMPYDKTGDGRGDLIVSFSTEVCDLLCGTIHEHFTTKFGSTLFASNGSGFAPVTDGSMFAANAALRTSALDFHLGDWNRDLHADTYYIKHCLDDHTSCTPGGPAEMWMGANNYPVFVNGAYQALGRTTPSNAQNLSFFDYDGDGTTDVVVANNAGTWDVVSFASGSPEAYRTRLGIQAVNGKIGGCTVVADTNGDGVPDFVDVEGTYDNLESLGNGDVVSHTTSFTNVKCPDNSPNDPAVVAIDYNQDGLQDVLILSRTGAAAGDYARVLESQPGGGMIVRTLPIVLGGDPGNAIATVGDFNGDGLFDIAQVRNGQLEVWTQTTSRADLLTQVVDGEGVTLRKVDYAALTETGYVRPCGSTSCYLGPTVVVTDEWLPDQRGGGSSPATGALGTTATFLHSYADARVDGGGAGWLGFGQHTITDTRNNSKHRITYDHTAVTISKAAGGGTFTRYPYHGRPVEDLMWVPVGSVTKAHRASYGYAVQTGLAANGATTYFAYQASTIERDYEGAFDPNNPDAGPLPVVVGLVVDAAPTAWGDITSEQTAKGAGFGTTTTRTFSNDPSTWLVGLLTDETTSSGTATRETSYTYEPGTRLVRDSVRQPKDTTGTMKRCSHVVSRNYGLPTQVDTTPAAVGGACTLAPRSELIAYDADFTFVTSRTRVLSATDPSKNLVTQQSVHPGLGVTYRTIDPSGLETLSLFDGFGRARQVNHPDGSFERLDEVTAPAPYGHIVNHVSGPQTIVSLDKLGREARRTSVLVDGSSSIVDTGYDAFGRIAWRTRPNRAAPLLDAQQNNYDAAGRTTSICRGSHAIPGSVCKTTVYSVVGGNQTTDDYDEDHVRKTTTRDNADHVVATARYPKGVAVTTKFGYGGFDAVTSTTDALGNVVSNTLDDLGRRTKLTDKDLGSITTTYNPFGEVVAEKDGAGVTTTIDRDLAGRIIDRIAPDGTDTFAYDTAGKDRLASKSRGAISTAYVYTASGQVAREHWTVDGLTYDLDYTYNALGQPLTTTYPAMPGQAQRFAIQEIYARGLPQSVVDLSTSSAIWTASVVDASNHVTTQTLGNGLSTTQTFDALTGRMLSTSTPIRYVPHFASYVYTDAGDMASRTTRTMGTPNPTVDKIETFGYDTAHELTSATIGTSVTRWDYDVLGNTTLATDRMPGCTTQYGSATTGPHALTAFTCAGVVHPFTYDANGDTTSYFDGNSTSSFTYTSFHKVKTMDNAAGEMLHTYDADHVRIKKDRPITRIEPPPYADRSGIWANVITIGPFESRKTPEQTVTDFVASIYVGGRVVAERYWRWNGLTGTLIWQYLHPDALGSPERGSDAGGNYADLESFDAWGNFRGYDWTPQGGPPALSRVGFTGQASDAELWITDMGGRSYQAAYHRFLQPDPTVPDPTDGASWNRYSYVRNRPTHSIDPSGYDDEDNVDEVWTDDTQGISFNTPSIEKTDNETCQLDGQGQVAVAAPPNDSATQQSALQRALSDPNAFTLTTSFGQASSPFHGGDSGNAQEQAMWSNLVFAGLATAPAFVATAASQLNAMQQGMARAGLSNPQMRWIYGPGGAPPPEVAYGINFEATAVVGSTGFDYTLQAEHFSREGDHLFYSNQTAVNGFNIGLSVSINAAVSPNGGLDDWYGQFHNATLGVGPLSVGAFWSDKWIGTSFGFGQGLGYGTASITDTDTHGF